MAQRGRPKAELVLTDEEREQLQRWSRRRKSSQALALRSRIVLACAAGADNKTVALDLNCAQATVGKWRARFVEHRLDGLADDDRPGRPSSITLDQVEDVVVATLAGLPKMMGTHLVLRPRTPRSAPCQLGKSQNRVGTRLGVSRWTTRTLADEVGFLDGCAGPPATRVPSAL